MNIVDGSLFGALKEKIAWHQARHGVLARNVAQSDTGGAHSLDLVPLRNDLVARRLAVTQSDSAHQSAILTRTRGSAFRSQRTGETIDLEAQMALIAQNQIDHEMAVSIYGRMLDWVRLVGGRR